MQQSRLGAAEWALLVAHLAAGAFFVALLVNPWIAACMAFIYLLCYGFLVADSFRKA
ncbi:MAG: hypothetical protein BroJett014_04650 [Planctomycetota bacterium]|nr:MAG: hypothetical protein BroJett014_04650 [Planctomycetota bacterium]